MGRGYLVIIVLLATIILASCAQQQSSTVSQNDTPPPPTPPHVPTTNPVPTTNTAPTTNLGKNDTPTHVPTTNSEKGFLEGSVSIGPICGGGEPIHPTPACQPTAETYKAYPIGVWTPDGENKVTVLNPALDGSYRVALSPGEYVVRLDKPPSPISSGFSKKVTITTRATTTLNVDIDTGIR